MADTESQTTSSAAAAFCHELNELCHKHNMMLWTAFHSTPIMVSVVANAGYHYVIERHEVGNAMVLRRVFVENQRGR